MVVVDHKGQNPILDEGGRTIFVILIALVD